MPEIAHSYAKDDAELRRDKPNKCPPDGRISDSDDSSRSCLVSDSGRQTQRGENILGCDSADEIKGSSVTENSEACDPRYFWACCWSGHLNNPTTNPELCGGLNCWHVRCRFCSTYVW